MVHKDPNSLLVGGFNPLKNMSSPVGMMTFPIYGKIIQSCSKAPTSSLTTSILSSLNEAKAGLCRQASIAKGVIALNQHKGEVR